MKPVLSMIRKEFLQLRRDPRMTWIMFATPVIQLLLLGYAANLDVRNIPAVVCDQDHSARSRDFLDGFLNSGYFTLAAEVSRTDEVDGYLDNGEASMALIIPRGFADDIVGRRKAEVLVIADGSESQSATIGINYAEMISARYAAKIGARLFERLEFQGIRRIVVQPEVRVWYNPDLKSRNFMVPGVLGLILLIMTMILTSMAVVREKETGTMEQLIVTPIHPLQIIVGKLLPFVLIGLIDTGIVLAVARWAFEVPVRGSVPLLFGLSLAFMLNTLGIGLFISTISRNQQQAMLTSVFFMIPMILLSGFVFPIENMPRLFQFVTRLVPLRYYYVIIRGIMLKASGWPELWPQAATLLGLGLAVLGLSIARFHKKLD